MKKLLIVDDEELMRRKLEKLLDYSLMGLQLVAQAQNGSTGEQLILQNQPDVVITDVVMPGKNGLEMIAGLQDKTKAKFIILSGYQDFGYVQEALRLGVADYVLKPVQALELKRALERVLAAQPKEEDEKRRYGEIIARVLSLVEEKLSNPELSLKSLCANFLFMNETYVGRLFQKRTGQKFSNYVTACRIQTAQALLIHQPELSIGEVAERVGFSSDAKYFIEVFRKSVGITPGKFRTWQANEVKKNEKF
ncbi:MAG: response regulator transcription factor [Christensenellales bacterium]|jgi:two-component system response regulator YesN